MIEHVYRRTALNQAVSEVIIATCDEEIMDEVGSFGGRVVMTAGTHTRASDRVVEAAQDVAGDLIVMVQGDEPMVHPEMIDEAIAPMLRNPDIGCVNLVSEIRSEADHQDPDTVKVVSDQVGRALYFSREPIPNPGKFAFADVPTYKQVCIIPFRRETLDLYAKLEPTPLEKAESIDMLRFLEHGYGVHLAETKHETTAVDRPEDRARVEELLREDPVLPRYLERSA